MLGYVAQDAPIVKVFTKDKILEARRMVHRVKSVIFNSIINLETK